MLSGDDNSNGHILIQTSNDDVNCASDFVDDQSADNILVRALEGLQDSEKAGGRLSTPLSSGESRL